MRFLLVTLLLAVLAVPAVAQPPWYARGTFNAWGTGNGSSLNPVDPFPMIDQGGGEYTVTIGADGDFFDNLPFNWKIAGGGADNWATSMPASDSRVYTDANGQINFHLYDQTTWNDGWFPNNTRRVGYDDSQLFDWEVIGSLNNWRNNGEAGLYMTDLGNGLHRLAMPLDAGIYDFKFRMHDSWDVSIGNDFGNGAGNNTIAVSSNGDEWIFELDLPKGRWRAYTEAAPPGQDGDFNGNGIVDAADYTVWRDNYGTTNQLPHDPIGGTIGSQQYDVWKAHFGQGNTLTWLALNTPVGSQTKIPDQELTSLGGGQYELNMTGLTPGDDYDFKVAQSDLSTTAPGSNVRVRADASGNIGLNFFDLQGDSWSDGWSPSNKDRVGYDDPEQFGWEIVGSFNSWPGSNDAAYALQDQGGGLYTGEFTFAAADTYQFKFRHLDETNPWNISIGDDFGNAAGNNTFTTTSANELWHFELDLPNGRWRAYLDGSGAAASAVPEPCSLAMAFVALCFGVAAMDRRRD